jgi:hypothetical protein
MPYIPEIYRKPLVEGKFVPISAGELNFVVTYLCDRYLKDDLSYNRINEVIGVLECCKTELYRRIAAPYEDTKIMEHGDVYKTKVIRKKRNKETL